MARTTLLILALCLTPALLGLAALPSASAHVCIEGARAAGCHNCPDLGLYHWHPTEIAGGQFAYAVCVLP